jgi:hypothetical protein
MADTSGFLPITLQNKERGGNLQSAALWFLRKT